MGFRPPVPLFSDSALTLSLIASFPPPSRPLLGSHVGSPAANAGPATPSIQLVARASGQALEGTDRPPCGLATSPPGGRRPPRASSPAGRHSSRPLASAPVDICRRTAIMVTISYAAVKVFVYFSEGTGKPVASGVLADTRFPAASLAGTPERWWAQPRTGRPPPGAEDGLGRSRKATRARGGHPGGVRMRRGECGDCCHGLPAREAGGS